MWKRIFRKQQQEISNDEKKSIKALHSVTKYTLLKWIIQSHPLNRLGLRRYLYL